MNIYLIGYRGTGKSTVAALLAKSLGIEWVDTDTDVERTAGETIAEIFSSQGEEAFRDLESASLERIAEVDPQVVATGGGIVLRRENRELLSATGRVVWLKASAETIHDRLVYDPATRVRRPNLTNKGGLTEIRDLLTQRAPIYHGCADLEVDTEDKPPEAVCEEIVDWLQANA